MHYVMNDSMLSLDKKPKEADYPSIEKSMVQRAIRHVSWHVLTKYGFPDEEMGKASVHQIWRDECKARDKEHLVADDERVYTLVSISRDIVSVACH